MSKSTATVFAAVTTRSLTKKARMSSTVGEVAREAGVSPHTVRFYEQHGLIAAERTSGNQRRTAFRSVGRTGAAAGLG